MSRGRTRFEGDFEWRPYAPKQPPPAHGIKIGKIGTSWWGKQWLSALELVLGADSRRLARGRSYARSGRTHDLRVLRGKVQAQVTGSRDTPYKITVALTQLSDPTWQRVIAGMAEKAQFSAELLANQMPEQLDDIFRSANTSLFPRDRADLLTSCTCPDWGDPCKHVAATHYVLGDALDRDPFLLFELRGRTKEQVLSALRSARSAEPARSNARRKKAPPDCDASPDAAPQVPRLTLQKLSAADYDRPKPMPALQFSFDAPAAHGAVLRQLGVPTTWRADASPADALAPLVRAAAENARRIALAEPQISTIASETEPRGQTGPDQPRPQREKTRRPKG